MEIARAPGGIGSACDIGLSVRRSPAAIFPASLAAVLDDAGEFTRAGACGGSARNLHPVLLVAAAGGSGGVTRNFRCSHPAERQRISTVT